MQVWRGSRSSVTRGTVHTSHKDLTHLHHDRITISPGVPRREETRRCLCQAFPRLIGSLHVIPYFRPLLHPTPSILQFLMSQGYDTTRFDSPTNASGDRSGSETVPIYEVLRTTGTYFNIGNAGSPTGTAFTDVSAAKCMFPGGHVSWCPSYQHVNSPNNLTMYTKLDMRPSGPVQRPKLTNPKPMLSPSSISGGFE